ncbi:bifunctional aminoglycoside phosphotransferase/ATP-binding protein [Roseivivax sediminis]|uniref:Aminoglycoside phosphotransferase domain-containing protein n=1 Tax=Roseivivax sediminis TaxID=936889 RepID=A0A1I1X634_9RHOB|nr:AAA family ATPase [Roseivivax sediminis]SFE02875.1 hypothetical protein SAMN04515678_105254 [Roseivivax sediminis]
MTDRQDEVVAFLSDPATHDGAEVDVVETHAALVFLAGDRALKMKRAVQYDYLDFSDLGTRREMLERELELNAPGAPEIYREVIAVTDTADGLALGGDGAAVEWVLSMSRFDTENELSRVAERGALDTRLAFDLGRSVAQMHARAPLRQEDGATLVDEIVEELAQAFATMEDALGAESSEALTGALRNAASGAAEQLSQRSTDGHVRRCHGDLHLHNLVLIDGRPVPFDALEFDERLGTCDVLYDLAFLLMDLRHRGLTQEASVTLSAWASAMEGAEDDGLGALPLFVAMRAAIRAMVLIQTDRASAHEGRSDGEARRYVQEARSALAPAEARLVAIGGRSGSGKSTMARHIAPDLGPVGALHLASDVERKTMMGVGPFDPLPESAYTEEKSAQLYDRLLGRAEAALASGMSALLDATFLDPAQRRAAAELAARKGVRFDGVWLGAPEAELLRRVDARHGDSSDADAAVVSRQSEPDDLGRGWSRIDAGGGADTVAARLRALL